MNAQAIATLLQKHMGFEISSDLAGKLETYLGLLVRWNARTNVSAIRDPESIVLRHFGESLQCAEALPDNLRALLDYGSGGGFPGVLCALTRPELAVTLAESQNKKAAFLQELCRTLSLNAEVYAGRVEALPAEVRFDAVTLRAVDCMEEACVAASKRIRPGGWLVILATEDTLTELAAKLGGIAWEPVIPLRGSRRGRIALGRVLAS